MLRMKLTTTPKVLFGKKYSITELEILLTEGKHCTVEKIYSQSAAKINSLSDFGSILVEFSNYDTAFNNKAF